MIPYARLTPGPGFAPERALLYYAQRLVTVPAARNLITVLLAWLLSLRHRASNTPPAGEAAAHALSDLSRSGLAVLAPLLSEAEIAQMSAYFLGEMVLAPNGALVPLSGLATGVATAAYPLSTVLNCPGMLALLNHPAILWICGRYLGCKPTLSSVGVRWSLPGAAKAVGTQQFHRDVDDWRFLKLFIYLTDVDEGSGPHTYVRGSHVSAFGPKAKAYSRDALERRFGADALTTVTGPKGTTFMADTLGAHRGDVPTDRPRLILQAQYSLLPVYAFKYEPVEHLDPTVDPYLNRLLVRTRAHA